MREVQREAWEARKKAEQEKKERKTSWKQRESWSKEGREEEAGEVGDFF